MSAFHLHCVHVCARVCRPDVTSGVIFRHLLPFKLHLYLLRRCLSLVSECQGTACPYIPCAGITNAWPATTPGFSFLFFLSFKQQQQTNKNQGSGVTQVTEPSTVLNELPSQFPPVHPGRIVFRDRGASFFFFFQM